MLICGVILAGGGGRRMGGADKAMLMLNGLRLLDHAIMRLHPQVTDLAISANGLAQRFGSTFAVLPDKTALGPLAGILAAMGWARGLGADYVASVAVDTPYFPCDLVAQLALAMQQDAADAGLALARSQGRVHGTFGLWPISLEDDLAQFLNSGAKPRVLDFAARHRPAYADFAWPQAFANINTPQDLAEIQSVTGGAA
jgi:molybdopterin-guanine dinucleotide biosynthesis protein A